MSLELAIFMWSLEIEVTVIASCFPTPDSNSFNCHSDQHKDALQIVGHLDCSYFRCSSDLFVDYTPLTCLLITGACTEFSNKLTHLVGFPRYYCDLLATITIRLAVSSRDSSASWLALYQLRCLYPANSRGAKR